MERLHSYIKSSLQGFSQVWDPLAIAYQSNIIPPDDVFLGGTSLLKNDINLQWLAWFCESLCNLDECSSVTDPYKVFSLVRRGLISVEVDESDPSFFHLCDVISKFMFNRINNLNGRLRQHINKQLKIDLIESSNGHPRCWICKSEFKQDAIDIFLGGKKEIILPEYVDYMMPRGLIDRDLKIEVEHKLPFSKGGGDIDSLENIALSCGWCNRYKSNFISIYDVGRNLKTYKNASFTGFSIPEPYWIIRKLALATQCSHKKCSLGRNNQLYIDLINPRGAANPINLQVVCKKHVHDYHTRLVPRENYKDCIQNKAFRII
ncbi:HNH endonuclease [Enterobacter bugandensis]|uniref:HNH endonuclease n=1 Tax=Enterobacter bugandensis TaxID=881260 RepID=UPI00283AB74C|nr:HNH endonuclease [Enterobacter bugandensis]WMU73475.1 HNH endonuclease [Enterobacter bugandensis]